MAITIPNAFVETFESKVRHLAQQGEAKLRNYVSEVNDGSKSHNWDRLAPSTVRAKTSVRMASPAGGSGSGAVGTTDGLTWDRRNTLIQTWDWGEIVASEEVKKMLAVRNPSSDVAMNGAMAMRRAVDDVIVAGANDPAGDGKGGTVAFPAAQTVGTGVELMDIAMLATIGEMFLSKDIDPDEEKFLAIGPKQWQALMNDTKATSADYQSLKALATGVLPNFMGFSKIIITNRLGNHATPPTAGEIYCLAWTRKAIGLHVAGDIRASIAPRPDMSFETQFYLQMDMDAVRVEDERIVRVHIKDAAK